MIPDNFVHDQENSEDTQQHLQENADKFENACQFLLNKMLHGERLSGKTVMQKYGVHDRRLRDLEIAGKCSKVWVCDERGKRKFVEYFIEIQKPPTKGKIVRMWQELIQPELF